MVNYLTDNSSHVIMFSKIQTTMSCVFWDFNTDVTTQKKKNIQCYSALPTILVLQ